MVENFAEILASLTRLQRPVVRWLNDGIAPSTFAARCADASVPHAEDLARLYAWRDGTELYGGASLDDLHLFPGYYLLSSADALTAIGERKGLDVWAPGCFPVFANGGGDFFVRLSDGPIIDFAFDDPNAQDVAYPSLQNMFQVLAECFATGAFFVADGVLELDDARHAAIARKLNPGLAYWNGR
jgi:hypothetical protein